MAGEPGTACIIGFAQRVTVCGSASCACVCLPLLLSDLYPLIEALVNFHPDLASFRHNPFHLNAYVTTVSVSVFCSLHGQGTTKITYGEMKGSNLVDAFELVATQTTRNVRPFCVAYFEEIFTSYVKVVRRGLCPLSCCMRPPCESFAPVPCRSVLVHCRVAPLTMMLLLP
jgi:hypothetical protein